MKPNDPVDKINHALHPTASGFRQYQYHMLALMAQLTVDLLEASDQLRKGYLNNLNAES